MKQTKLYKTVQDFANRDTQQQLYLAGKNEKKEETIEEALERLGLKHEHHIFEAGVNWQKEQDSKVIEKALGEVDRLSHNLQKMYTEEEVLELLNNWVTKPPKWKNLKVWFEQNKKK
jgi:hypothetical protein